MIFCVTCAFVLPLASNAESQLKRRSQTKEKEKPAPAAVATPTPAPAPANTGKGKGKGKSGNPAKVNADKSLEALEERVNTLAAELAALKPEKQNELLKPLYDQIGILKQALADQKKKSDETNVTTENLDKVLMESKTIKAILEELDSWGFSNYAVIVLFFLLVLNFFFDRKYRLGMNELARNPEIQAIIRRGKQK